MIFEVPAMADGVKSRPEQASTARNRAEETRFAQKNLAPAA